MARTHGRSSTYSAGCRCTECRAAHTVSRQRYRPLYAQRLADGKPVCHGKYSTYVNYACRCDLCTKANTAAMADYRARKRRPPSTPEKGTTNGHQH